MDQNRLVEHSHTKKSLNAAIACNYEKVSPKPWNEMLLERISFSCVVPRWPGSQNWYTLRHATYNQIQLSFLVSSIWKLGLGIF